MARRLERPLRPAWGTLERCPPSTASDSGRGGSFSYIHLQALWGASLVAYRVFSAGAFSEFPRAPPPGRDFSRGGPSMACVPRPACPAVPARLQHGRTSRPWHPGRRCAPRRRPGIRPDFWTERNQVTRLPRGAGGLLNFAGAVVDSSTALGWAGRGWTPPPHRPPDSSGVEARRMTIFS